MNTSSPQLPSFLTIAMLADRMGFCQKTIRRWIEAGDLRAHRLGRQIRVSEEDAVTFVASRRR